VSCARTSAGVALTEEDMRYCSELISKIIAEEMEKVIGEAFSTAFDIGLRGWAEACEAGRKRARPSRLFSVNLRTSPR